MGDRVSVKKIIMTAAIVNLVQIGAIIAALLYLYFERKPLGLKLGLIDIKLFLYIIVFTILMNCFLMFKYAYLIIYNSNHNVMLSETNSQLEHLNHTLRSQRHDFMNHLQVVHSLIELDEFKDAKDYIERIYDDIQKVNEALRTSNAAVNALLQAKILHAEKLNILIQVNITTPLKHLEMPSWEFCKILSNLIDNAIYALSEINANKVLRIELFEDLKTYGFAVCNNGPVIPDELLEKIFESGFTTKGEKGEGMGLAIIKETLQQYGGSISVSSDVHLTVFRGWIPKKGN